MSNFSDLAAILVGILAIGIVLFLVGNYLSKRSSKLFLLILRYVTE